MCKIKEETISYFIKQADTARKDYNNRIKNLTNKFFKDNNIPFKVGDRVMIATGNIGTISSLYAEPYKHSHYCNYIPMVRVKLDENTDLDYFAVVNNIKKI